MTHQRSSISFQPNPTSHDPNTGCIGVLLRVFWMMLGNAGVALCAIYMLLNPENSLSILDGIFWFLVVLILVARYVDIVLLKGRTSDGAPATLAHFQRHFLMLLAISTLAWGLARWTMVFG